MTTTTRKPTTALLNGFVESLLWAETLWDHPRNMNDDGENEGDRSARDLGLGIDDLSPEALAACEAFCLMFEDECSDLVIACEGMEWDQAGHDLWLTTRGHGAGFWDGDWPEPEASKLTDWCKSNRTDGAMVWWNPDTETVEIDCF